jgi:DNA polymerase-4
METEHISFNPPRTAAVKKTRGPWLIDSFAGSRRFEPVGPERTRVGFRYELRKPDALLVIAPEQVQEILHPLPVSRLWGVGAKAERRLHGLGIRTIGQLAALPEKVLVGHFGESRRHLWEMAHGLDDRPVVPDEIAKSVSTETMFARDIGSREMLRSWLLGLVDHLGQRLRHNGVRARTIEIKARTSDFKTYIRSVTLREPTDATEVIWQAAMGLFEQRVPQSWLPLRLLGVGGIGLVREEQVQANLFEGAWQAKQRSLDQAVDAIREQFGGQAIKRGGVWRRGIDS